MSKLHTEEKVGGWVGVEVQKQVFRSQTFSRVIVHGGRCVCGVGGGCDEGGGGHDMFTVLVLKMGRQLLIQQERKNQGRLLNSGLPTFLSGVRSFQIHFIVDRKRKRRSGIPI